MPPIIGRERRPGNRRNEGTHPILSDLARRAPSHKMGGTNPRHECGTKICREKGIEYARRMLGYANIATTQRYMHLDDRELADAQDLVPLFVSTPGATFCGGPSCGDVTRDLSGS